MFGFVLTSWEFVSSEALTNFLITTIFFNLIYYLIKKITHISSAFAFIFCSIILTLLSTLLLQVCHNYIYIYIYMHANSSFHQITIKTTGKSIKRKNILCLTRVINLYACIYNWVVGMYEYLLAWGLGICRGLCGVVTLLRIKNIL